MPFTAILDGKLIDATQFTTDEWNAFQGVYRNYSLQCPDPKCQSDMMLVRNHRGTQFFRHFSESKSDCSFRKHPDTEQHLFLQNMFSQAIQDCGWKASKEAFLKVLEDSSKRRADVLAVSPDKHRQVAFEIQLSGQNSAEFEERTHRYDSVGVETIWVNGKSNWNKQGRFHSVKLLGESTDTPLICVRRVRSSVEYLSSVSDIGTFIRHILHPEVQFVFDCEFTTDEPHLCSGTTCAMIDGEADNKKRQLQQAKYERLWEAFWDALPYAARYHSEFFMKVLGRVSKREKVKPFREVLFEKAQEQQSEFPLMYKLEKVVQFLWGDTISKKFDQSTYYDPRLDFWHWVCECPKENLEIGKEHRPQNRAKKGYSVHYVVYCNQCYKGRTTGKRRIKGILKDKALLLESKRSWMTRQERETRGRSERNNWESFLTFKISRGTD